MTEKRYDNTDSGALFANERQTGPNSPSHKGQCELCCPHCGAVQKYWISAWVKTARGTMKKFFSFAFTADQPDINRATPQGFQQRGNFQAPAPQQRAPLEPPIDFDDDIPF